MSTPARGVWILMGSDSDWGVMKEAASALGRFGVPYEVFVTSAHRSPRRTAEIVARAHESGVAAFIVGAGAAAHLAGVVAAETPLPVLGVPIDSSSLQGLDALLSTLQMPGGVPVAGMAIGKAGARNAGLFAVQILATADETLAERYRAYKAKTAAEVSEKHDKLMAKIREEA